MAVFLLATAVWLATILYAQLQGDVAEVAQVEQSVEWQEFDEARIDELVAEGRVVFVDVTAKWCVNCQINKLNVTGTDEMEQFFADENVVLMRGDMTRPNAILLDYIRKYRRSGIPFNAVYGAGLDEPIVLAPLLSKDAVKDAVLEAQKG